MPSRSGTRRPAATLFVFAFAVAGCGDLAAPENARSIWEFPYVGAPCDLTSPGPALSALQRDSLPGPGRHITMDDRNAEIARQAPGGWGGTFEKDGRLTIYLVHPELASEALSALNGLGASVGFRPVILKGRWDFAQLYDWYRYLVIRGVWIDGVWMSDIQEATNRLEYGVTPAALPEFADRLTALGVPCGLVRAHVGETRFVLDGA